MSARTEEPITFTVGGLRLDGRVAVPDRAVGAAVLCHPHPQYGGDMDNDVVRLLADRLRCAGVATLRFNFRGVGNSEGAYGAGVGEADDARAALAALRGRSGLARATLAGYSFGAMVALAAGRDHPDVDRLLAVAPPWPMFDVGFLATCDKPKLFLLGDRDQFCPFATLERAVAALPGPNRLVRLPGADHFLGNAAGAIGDAAADFVTAAA